MSRCSEPFTVGARATVVAVLAGACLSILPLAHHARAAETSFPGIGRAATPAEIAAWDIDVRPDFAGLPKGSGTVDRGQTVWEDKCASCHGTFGESNQVFTPLVGGVTKEDLKTGHVATLLRPDFPQRTTFMKVATVSTLFDYIRRAMPWNAPKSLSDDDVYAVLAFLLNLSDIVPEDFVLSDQTIREVQAIMPNRNGMTTAHALWPGAGFGTEQTAPDTHNSACMAGCKPSAVISSRLPDYALGAHGNLAGQNRLVGPVRGLRTGPDEPADSGGQKPAAIALAEQVGCFGCHALTEKLVGPAYREIATRYRGQDQAAALIRKIKEGGEGVWGDVAMPAQPDLPDDDLKTLVAWILAGAPEK